MDQHGLVKEMNTAIQKAQSFKVEGLGDEPILFAAVGVNNPGIIWITYVIALMFISSTGPVGSVLLFAILTLSAWNDNVYLIKAEKASAMAGAIVGDDVPTVDVYPETKPLKEKTVKAIPASESTLLEVPLDKPLTEYQPSIEAPRFIEYTHNATLPKSVIHKSPVKPSGTEWDLIGELAANLKSTLIIGVPGAGKGMLMSHLIRRIKQSHPDMKIVGIDPKDDPKESGYWESGFDEVYRCNSGQMDDLSFVEWVGDCINHFRHMQTENKLLLIDEWSVVCRRWSTFDKKGFDGLINYLTFVGSSGDSRREYVIGVGQVANAGDMGMSGGIRGIFKPIGILSNHDRRAVQLFCRTSFTTMPDGGVEELYGIMNKSPVGRAVFSWQHGEWRPMPKLENLCGYDRDTRQHLGKPIEPKQLKLPMNNTVSPALMAKAAPTMVIDDPFPVVRDAIKKWRKSGSKTSLCGAELLEWMINQGNGETFASTDIVQSSWAGRWIDTKKERRVFVNRSYVEDGPRNILTMLRKFRDKGILQTKDERNWKIVLR